MTTTTLDAVKTGPPAGGRFARAGSLWGLLGAVCCVGNALAVATGLGALSFFGVWMDQYQVYFVLASLAAMAAVLTWMIRRLGLRSAKRVVLRHAVVMVVAYVVTLGVATMISGLIAG
ncbi:MAG TPA: hypothetical protein VFM37_13505 [Pseudonocardiaceae bacterium]|nr:hypothetical protein [Pseudonocardiaceae bacterium]